MQSIMLMLFSVLMFLMPCSLYSQSKSEESLKSESFDDAHLTVIYTSDLQQRLIESFEGGVGLSELSAVVEYARKRDPLLVLDAGGSSLREFMPAESGVRQAEVRSLYAKLLDEIGYSAQVPGSTELAWGLRFLYDLEQATSFPLLCANLRAEEGIANSGPHEIFESSYVVPIEGIGVGLFGITSPDSRRGGREDIAAPGFQISDPITAAERAVAELKQNGAEVIIAVTHLGLFDLYERGYLNAEDIERAEERLSGHIDLIIDAGNSTNVHPGVFRLGKTVLAAAGGTDAVDGAEITVRDGRVSNIDIRPVNQKTFEEAGLKPDPEVAALIGQISAALQKPGDQPLTAQKETEVPSEQVAPEENIVDAPTEADEETAQADTTPEAEKEIPKIKAKPKAEEKPKRESPEDGFVMPQLELFLVPGLTLYSGATGFGFTIGAMSDLEELFSLSSAAGNVMLSILLRYDTLRMSAENLNLDALGPAVAVGYRLAPADFFADFALLENMRLIPRLTLGGMSLNVRQDDRSAYSGFSAYIAPGVLIDKKLPLEIDLRAGLAAEYNMTFGDSVWRSWHTGAFVSWTY